MSARAIHAESGLEGYDGAQWRDWVPSLDCVHRSGPLSTLRQRVPRCAAGATETTVPPNGATVLLFWPGRHRKKVFRVAGRQHHTEQGQWSAVLLPAGIDSWWWLPTPENVEGAVHVHIDPAFHDAIADAEGLPRTAALPALPGWRDSLLAATAESLIDSLTSTDVPSRLMWETSATNIVLRLGRLGSQRLALPARTGRAADWRIRRSVEEIEARLGEDLGLVELAASAGLSTSHYAVLFRAAMGMAPHCWLVQRRIARSCEMLMNPHRNVTEIALELGFSSSQHFATAFRKQIGVTPREWRRQRLM